MKSLQFGYTQRLSLGHAEKIIAAAFENCGGRRSNFEYPGMVLSIHESNVVDNEEEQTATKTVTIRFENGAAVRMSLRGWSDSHYGFQWKIEQSELRLRRGHADKFWMKVPDYGRVMSLAECVRDAIERNQTEYEQQMREEMASYAAA